MRASIAGLFMLAFLFATPAFAVMEDYPSVKLQGLDKSVGRTVTFEAKVGSTIQYGPLFIKIHACRKAPPIEKPESAAFLQIWEVPPGAEKSEWAFSGWMFASSPALSAMDHPVYDVWVLDCLGREEPNAEAKAAETEEEADQADLPAAEDSEAPVVDSEAEDQTPVDSEAEPESPAPAATPETPSVEAVDSEAEEQPFPTEGATPVPVPAESVPAQPSPDEAYPAYDPNAAVAPPASSTDEGFTAYDLMRQQGGVSR